MKLVLPFSEKDSALKETNSFPLAGNFFLVEKIPFAKRLGFEVLKFFFSIHNSAELEIYSANKSQITNICKLFLAKHS